NDGGDVRLDLAACDQDEQRDDGHRGCDRRQHGVVERIIDLIPVHYVFSPSTFWRCRPAWTAGALASISRAFGKVRRQTRIRLRQIRSQTREMRGPLPPAIDRMLGLTRRWRQANPYRQVYNFSLV